MIKKRRHELGLSQEELAERLNISISTLGMIETGARAVSTKYIRDWCDYLQIDYNKFICGEEDGKQSIEIAYCNAHEILNKINTSYLERYNGEFKIYLNLLSTEFLKNGYELVAIKRK